MTGYWPVTAAVLAVINLASFALYGVDKARAKRGAWRIRESTLLGAAACFGALGALLGMQLFRHKTKHRAFALGVPALLIVQAAILAVVSFWGR